MHINIDFTSPSWAYYSYVFTIWTPYPGYINRLCNHINTLLKSKIFKSQEIIVEPWIYETGFGYIYLRNARKSVLEAVASAIQMNDCVIDIEYDSYRIARYTRPVRGESTGRLTKDELKELKDHCLFAGHIVSERTMPGVVYAIEDGMREKHYPTKYWKKVEQKF